MPVSPDDMPTYRALQKKSQALFDYGQKLLAQRGPLNAFRINREVERADWELERVKAVMLDLRENNEINFPSGPQFEAMQNSVAALRDAISRSAAVSSLIAAGSAVIAAWPQ